MIVVPAVSPGARQSVGLSPPNPAFPPPPPAGAAEGKEEGEGGEEGEARPAAGVVQEALGVECQGGAKGGG